MLNKSGDSYEDGDYDFSFYRTQSPRLHNDPLMNMEIDYVLDHHAPKKSSSHGNLHKLSQNERKNHRNNHKTNKLHSQSKSKGESLSKSSLLLDNILNSDDASNSVIASQNRESFKSTNQNDVGSCDLGQSANQNPLSPDSGYAGTIASDIQNSNHNNSEVGTKPSPSTSKKYHHVRSMSDFGVPPKPESSGNVNAKAVRSRSKSPDNKSSLSASVPNQGKVEKLQLFNA